MLYSREDLGISRSLNLNYLLNVGSFKQKKKCVAVNFQIVYSFIRCTKLKITTNELQTFPVLFSMIPTEKK